MANGANEVASHDTKNIEPLDQFEITATLQHCFF